MRFFIPILLALCACQKTAEPEGAAASAASPALPVPDPNATDYRPFGLKLGTVAVLEEIIGQAVGKVRVTPSAGNRLVVVSLLGTVPSTMSLTIATRDFKAAFERTLKDAVAVQYSGLWMVSGNLDGAQSMAASMSFDAEKAKPMGLKIAFDLPQAIQRFDLVCSGLNLGAVTVETSTPATP